MDETTLASLSHLDDAELAVALANGGASSSSASSSSASSDHGWQKVTYPKRHRRAQAAGKAGSDPAADPLPNGSHVFDSVEKKANERHRALASAAAAAAAAEQATLARLKAAAAGSDDEEDESGEEGAPKENGTEEVKKVKQKKPKKPKVTVAEAAAKIDSADLAAFLVDITGSYEAQPDIQLMRFADYFGRSFSAVTAPQFPWQKVFKETPLAKIVDVPVSHISEPVYKTAVDWIAQRPVDALGNFVLWSLDCILADLASQQVSSKGSKKTAQQTSPKAQVAIFLVLAMTLRRKPDVLINLLPTLRDNSKYQGVDKLPVISWVIAQASQGDLAVGVYAWSRNLLPLLSGKSAGNPQLRDLVLQSVERFLAIPKARTNLVNNAVRKGERVVPPSAMEQLLRGTFPYPRVKAADRFEALYPTLKEIALAGATGSKALKPVAQQLLSISARLMREENPELSKEAADIFIWCLAQNTDCFKQWGDIYLDNLEASICVLKKLSEQWKDHSAKFSPDVVRETVKKLRIKNEEALSEEGDGINDSKIKEADKYCKVIAGKVAKGPSCVKVGGVLLLTAGVAAAALAYPHVDWNELLASLGIN